jgi:osmotically-inducible protein OsmY
MATNMSLVSEKILRGAVALALLCALAACATPRTTAQQLADKETAARVQAALDGDKQLYAKHIFVRVDEGVVHLSGYVWDPPDLQEAQQVAELVQGVTKVVNNLELQRNGVDDSGVAR